MALTSQHFDYLEKYFSGSQCIDAEAIGAWMRVRADIMEGVQNQTNNSSSPKLPAFDVFAEWWFDKSYSHAAEDVYHFFTGNFGH